MSSFPKISVILPTLGRPEGLARCLVSLQNQNYPEDLIQIWVKEDEPRLGVPKRVKQGVEETDGEMIVFASNDIEFNEDALMIATAEFDRDETLGLLAFNTGEVLPDEGNICEHFMIKRAILPLIDGEIFDCEFYHVGTDNMLWAKCKKLGMAKRSIDAIVTHYHFSTGKSDFDPIYALGWDQEKVEHDRNLLKIKLEKLYGRENP